MKHAIPPSFPNVYAYVRMYGNTDKHVYSFVFIKIFSRFSCIFVSIFVFILCVLFLTTIIRLV